MALRARQMVAEADREIGHGSVRDSAAASPTSNATESDWNGDDAKVRDIARQVEALMSEVQDDVRKKQSDSSPDET